MTIKGEQLSPQQRDELIQENYDVQAAGAAPVPTTDNGTVEKLGENAPATEFSAQLGQRYRKKASHSK